MSSLEALLKKYKNAIRDGAEIKERTWFSMGPLSLNLAIGHPLGVQSGRIVQIVGRESSGKSTLALDIIGQHQKSTGLSVIYVDFERSYTPEYAAACGVDTSKLKIVAADTTEEGLTIAEEAIKTGEIKLIVIDSIAAARPASELDKDYSDNQKMASNAGIITRFCNRIIPLADNNDALILVLNQLRMNFNTMSPEKEIPFGGQALRYATGVQIGLTRTGWSDDTMDVQALVRKNKVGAPRDKIEFSIQFGKGILHNQDIIQLGIERGFVTKAGSWFSYGNSRVQGIDKAAKEFPIQEIRAVILEQETLARI